MATEQESTLSNLLDKFTSSKILNEFSKNNKDKLIIIYFTAKWCKPCKTLYPFINEKIKQYTNSYFSIIDVDTDKYQELCDDFSIQAMPTILFYKNSVEIDKIVGVDKKKIEELIIEHK